MTGCSAQKNVAASLQSSAVTKTMFIPVEGMSCGSCAATVKRGVKRVDGVTDVEVSLEHRGGRVRYTEGRVTPTRFRLRSISSVTKLAVRRWNHDDSGCVSGEVCLQSAPWVSMGSSDYPCGRCGRKCSLPLHRARRFGSGRGCREFRHRREPKEWVLRRPGVFRRHRHEFAILGTIAGRLGTVLTQNRSVVTGHWVWPLLHSWPPLPLFGVRDLE